MDWPDAGAAESSTKSASASNVFPMNPSSRSRQPQSPSNYDGWITPVRQLGHGLRVRPFAAASSPEWLELAQLCVRFGGGRHGGIEARVFPPGHQPGREGKLAARSPARRCANDVFMHGDVVEIAEAVLQAGQSAEKLLSPLRHPFAR